MKKLAIPFVSLLSIISITSASAATSPLMIVNNSKLHVTVNYSLCDAKKEMCTLVKENTIKGSNHLSIVTELKPKLENLTIVGAVARDNSGKQVASLQGTCNLPAKLNTVVLNVHGTSTITCQYK